MALKDNNSSIIPSNNALYDAYMALKATLGNKIAPYFDDYGQLIEKGSPLNNDYQNLKQRINRHIPSNEDFKSPQSMSEWAQAAALNAPMGLSTKLLPPTKYSQAHDIAQKKANILAGTAGAGVIAKSLMGDDAEASNNSIADYREMARQAEVKYGLPMGLVSSVIETESGYDPKAYNKKSKAAGLAQFMPATAQEYGVDVNDPVSSIDGSARMLADLYQKYNGDQYKTLAGYNWGQGNVDRKGLHRAPKETRDYISKITGMLNPIGTANASEDFSGMSDDELYKMAGIDKPVQTQESTTDYSKMSDEELYSAAGIQPPNANPGPTPTGDLEGSTNLAATPTAGEVQRKIGTPKGFGEYGKALAGNIIPDIKNTAEGLYQLATTPVDKSVPAIAGAVAQWGKEAYNDPMSKVPSLTDIGDSIRDRPFSAFLTASPFMPKVPTRMLGNLSAANRPLALSKATLAKFKPAELRAVQAELQTGVSALAPGVKPTAAMLTTNNKVRDLETMARLRAKPDFFARDEANQAIMAQAIKNKAMAPDVAEQARTALNTQTSPMREAALSQADYAAGVGTLYTSPIEKLVNKLQTTPGQRFNPDVQKLVKKTEIIGAEDIKAADLYDLRKQLADALNSKAPMTIDEMTNAVKNQRRVATGLKNSIDEGLNNSSGGLFGDYIAAHRQGMIPINEGQAWQEVLGRFNNSPEIAPGLPRVTPAALRRSLNKETFSKSGRDLLTAGGREEADRLARTASAMERASSPRASIMGSQTTPLAIQLSQDILRNQVGGTPTLLANFGKGMADYLSGKANMTEALLNPEKLSTLIEKEITKAARLRRRRVATSAAVITSNANKKRQ